MKLYEETFDAVARIEEPADQALQHLNTVRSLFQHGQETGQENGAKFLFTETLKLVRQLKDVKQRLYLYGLCGILLAEQGQFSGAFAIADEIDLLLLDPEFLTSNSWKEEIEDKKNQLYAGIAENQAKHRQITDAMATADNVTDFDEYEQTLVSIASQLGKSDFEAQTHLKLLEELESPEQTASAYLVFAEICRKNEQMEQSVEFLQNVLQKADTEIENSEKKDEIYSKVISMLLTEQEKETVLERIKSPAVRVRLRLDLRLRGGDVEQDGGDAAQDIDRIIAEARQIESDSEKMDAFAQIGKALSHFDRPEESRNAFREAIRLVDSQKNVSPKNDYQKLQSLFLIARTLCECGERIAALNLYKRAIKIVESVEDLYFRYNWFRDISRNLLLDHFTEEGLEIIDRFSYSEQDDGDLNPRGLKRQSLDFRSFKSVLLHQESLARSQAARILQEESPIHAQEQLVRATDLARKILDPIMRAETLREIGAK